MNTVNCNTLKKWCPWRTCLMLLFSLCYLCFNPQLRCHSVHLWGLCHQSSNEHHDVRGPPRHGGTSQRPTHHASEYQGVLDGTTHAEREGDRICSSTERRRRVPGTRPVQCGIRPAAAHVIPASPVSLHQRGLYSQHCGHHSNRGSPSHWLAAPNC